MALSSSWPQPGGLRGPGNRDDMALNSSGQHCQVAFHFDTSKVQDAGCSDGHARTLSLVPAIASMQSGRITARPSLVKRQRSHPSIQSNPKKPLKRTNAKLHLTTKRRTHSPGHPYEPDASTDHPKPTPQLAQLVGQFAEFGPELRWTPVELPGPIQTSAANLSVGAMLGRSCPCCPRSSEEHAHEQKRVFG